MMKPRLKIAFRLGAAALAALAVLPACNFAPQIPTVEEMNAAQLGGKTHESFVKAVREGEARWSKRGEDPFQIKPAIDAFLRAAAIDPYDRYSRQYLALAYYYLANYYTPDEAEKEKLHMLGYKYGREAAELNPKVHELMTVGDKPKTFEEAVSEGATPGDVPGLYWMTVNMARAVENKSVAVRGTTAPKLKVVMEKIYRLGPTYYWGGVHRFFGAYYVKAPAQKEPAEQSKREFDRAVEVGKENLENFVLYAEYYAKFAQDRVLYEKLLHHVLAQKPEQDHPQLKLDNIQARKRAAKMLEKIDEDF